MKKIFVIITLALIFNIACSEKISPLSAFQYQTDGDILDITDARYVFIDMEKHIQNLSKSNPVIFMKKKYNPFSDLSVHGKQIICLVNAGTEKIDGVNYIEQIPKYVANQLDGKQDERWLSISILSISLKEIPAESKIRLAQQYGCDGVAFHNAEYEEYKKKSGVSFRDIQFINYFERLLKFSKKQGLFTVLYNNSILSEPLFNYFEAAFVDNCSPTEKKCTYLTRYIKENKAVFGVTYLDSNKSISDQKVDVCLKQYQGSSKMYSWQIKDQHRITGWIFDQC